MRACWPGGGGTCGSPGADGRKGAAGGGGRRAGSVRLRGSLGWDQVIRLVGSSPTAMVASARANRPPGSAASAGNPPGSHSARRSPRTAVTVRDRISTCGNPPWRRHGRAGGHAGVGDANRPEPAQHDAGSALTGPLCPGPEAARQDDHEHGLDHRSWHRVASRHSDPQTFVDAVVAGPYEGGRWRSGPSSAGRPTPAGPRQRHSSRTMDPSPDPVALGPFPTDPTAAPSCRLELALTPAPRVQTAGQPGGRHARGGALSQARSPDWRPRRHRSHPPRLSRRVLRGPHAGRSRARRGGISTGRGVGAAGPRRECAEPLGSGSPDPPVARAADGLGRGRRRRGVSEPCRAPHPRPRRAERSSRPGRWSRPDRGEGAHWVTGLAAAPAPGSVDR